MSILKELEEIQGYQEKETARKVTILTQVVHQKIPWEQITLPKSRINEIVLEAINEWLEQQNKKAS